MKNRLIELINDCRCMDRYGIDSVEKQAEYLLLNGVTIDKHDNVPTGWISIEERLPTEEENEDGIVGVVYGRNNNIIFEGAYLLVEYDFEEKMWWCNEYDIYNCKITHWMSLPKLHKEVGMYNAHEVACILAEVTGDDCACNVNGNDKWLPLFCELQEACPHPEGVACWEQYVKHFKKKSEKES